MWHSSPRRSRLSGMRSHFRILTPFLIVAPALFSAIYSHCLVQDAPGAAPQLARVALAKLAPPVYPPLARQTRIIGDVKLLLGIRPDGTAESAVVVSGHPLLQQAPLDSARQSQFSCGGCTEAVTPYTLVYTFQLTEATCPPSAGDSSKVAPLEEKPHSEVSQSQNHVRIITEAMIFCDLGVAFRKVRSVKCLYLWKCGWKP
jgi:hypothetical protein